MRPSSIFLINAGPRDTEGRIRDRNLILLSGPQNRLAGIIPRGIYHLGSGFPEGDFLISRFGTKQRYVVDYNIFL